MLRRHFLQLGPCCLPALAVLPASAPAQAADPLPGQVVLTISGRIKPPQGGSEARFDMTALERLPQKSFTTRTPWWTQPRKFTGPLLRDVLAAVGVHSGGGTLRAVALNDYRVSIPVDDVLRYDVLLARLMDDKPMPVRDKGPLFIIYPFDDLPELRNAVYYSRAAWQLKVLEVL